MSDAPYTIFQQTNPHSSLLQDEARIGIRRNPSLTVLSVGDPGTPPKSTLDPDILCWCEEHGFVLVTNNRSSMPVHLTDHINQGRHVPGIFILNPNLSMGQIIDNLIEIAEVSPEDKYQDVIIYLPVI